MEYSKYIARTFLLSAVILTLVAIAICAYFYQENSLLFHKLKLPFIGFYLFSIVLLIVCYKLTTHFIALAVTTTSSKLEQEMLIIQSFFNLINQCESLNDLTQLVKSTFLKLLPDFHGQIKCFKLDSVLTAELTWGNKQILKTASNTQHNLFEYDFDYENHVTGKFKLAHQKPLTAEVKQLASLLCRHINQAIARLLLQQELQNQAIKDPLTQLYNRRFMNQVLTQALHRAERHNQRLAVLMLDLDHFKQYNDKYGHAIGDYILKEVAGHIVKHSRVEDYTCRFGGEEFVLICPDTLLNDAFSLAEKLRLGIQHLKLRYQQQKLPDITVSIGIAIFPNHGQEIDALLESADKALYLAKNKGRNLSIVAPAHNSPLQGANW